MLPSRNRFGLFSLRVSDAEIRLVDILNALYILTNLTLIFLFRERLPQYKEATAGFVVCLAVQAFLILAAPADQEKGARRILRILRDFYPYVMTGFYYPTLGKMVTVIWDHHFDSSLISMERMLFGTDLSLVFHKLVPNLFVYEAMHFFYFYYYFFVFTVGYLLYRSSERENFHRFMFVVMLLVTCQFFFFILWPTAGPKYSFAELGGTHLPGRGPFSWIMHNMLVGGEVPVGAFPSSHVSVTFMAALFVSRHLSAYRFVFWVLFWGLFISTVYLQQHYAVDSFGGIAIVPVFYALGNRIYDFSLEYRKLIPAGAIRDVPDRFRD